MNPTPTQQPPPTTAFVTFSAEINANTSETLIATFTRLATQGVKEVHLLISTPGGNVTNGINVYNVLLGLPLRLITHNVGNVDSIGNAIFLAGNPRYACAGATFMFHGVAMNFAQAASLGEKALLENLDGVRREQGRIGEIIKRRTRIDEPAVESLFLEAQTKDANFALGCGIIDEIREVKIPVGTPIVSLVFQR